jgi:hypothetical protein
MLQLLPLLFALACPLGMTAMMAGPAVVRRIRRARQPADSTKTAQTAGTVKTEAGRS